jgi:hypothetical protein
LPASGVKVIEDIAALSAQRQAYKANQFFVLEFCSLALSTDIDLLFELA